MAIRAMGIRNRLLAGFLILGALVLTQGLMSLSTMAGLRDVTVEMETNAVPSLETLADINLTASRLRIFTLRMFIADSAEDQAQIKSRIMTLRDELVAKKAQYVKLISIPGEKEEFDKFSAAVLGYMARQQEVLDLMEAGKKPEAIELQNTVMNSFADHFLTDLFSAGHLRVPRKQLAAVVTPGELGSLISRFMHDEDSKFGLKVRNAVGDEWHAYGDKRYFDAGDAANRAQVKRAVQASADEVFDAFISGVAPSPATFKAPLYVPDLNAAQNPANNFSPLFKMEGDKVLRRKDVNDLNDKHWTADWWGWSTYLLLKDYTPNTPA